MPQRRLFRFQRRLTLPATLVPAQPTRPFSPRDMGEATMAGADPLRRRPGPTGTPQASALPTPAPTATPAPGSDGEARQAAANALAPILLAWLNQPTIRETRRALEAHPELLAAESDLLLQALERQYAGQASPLQSLREHRLLLREARARRGTPQAIRAAFVNQKGGLALDRPPWLEESERQAEQAGSAGQGARWGGGLAPASRLQDAEAEEAVG